MQEVLAGVPGPEKRALKGLTFSHYYVMAV
jgi:hypothetical protein